MIDFLGSLVCKFRGHKWRRARNGEPAQSKFCVRCGAGSAIKPRKAKEKT